MQFYKEKQSVIVEKMESKWCIAKNLVRDGIKWVGSDAAAAGGNYG